MPSVTDGDGVRKTQRSRRLQRHTQHVHGVCLNPRGLLIEAVICPDTELRGNFLCILSKCNHQAWSSLDCHCSAAATAATSTTTAAATAAAASAATVTTATAAATTATTAT